MLPTRDDIGKALTLHEEERLLAACEISRSRLLQPVVILALSTAMRYGEIRLLTWKQVDLDSATVVVGKSKTAAGTDRFIPLNSRALVTLRKLAEQFPDRCAYHYVFPSEKYGGFGDEFKAGFYNTDPTRPVGDWKEAWEAARRRAKGYMPVPRLTPHRVHENARGRSSVSCRRQYHGLERGNRNQNVEKIRSHWPKGSSSGGRFS
jgi:integrase